MEQRYSMLRHYSLVLLCMCFVYATKAQEPHIHNHSKKISLDNPSNELIAEIGGLGIDLKCGLSRHEGKVYLELAGDEVGLLDSNNIAYTIEIENLSQHIAERTAIELPVAIQELEILKQQALEENLQRSVSTTNTLISNVIQYEGPNEIDWSVPQNFDLGSMGGCLTYSEMLDELDEMRTLYPNLISVRKDASLAEDGSGTPITTHGNNFTNGGQYDTWPGQTIYYVRISDNPDSDEANEPESFFSGMTHSREVSSMMNLIYYMWYVLENYDTDPNIKSLVDNHEMYFIPVANPDGLLWNEQRDPLGGGLQRKNLRPNTGTNNSELRGVDLNRNYDYFWGSNTLYTGPTGVGSSGTASSNTYRGPSAASEPETQITEAFVSNHEVKTAVNHHAFSNLIPHAYNGFPGSTGSGREDEFAQYNQDLTRYNRYIYGEAPDILTIANGDMSDWMLGGAADLNGSTGSGEAILAQAPENGSSAEGSSQGGNPSSGFWPSAGNIYLIAQRAMRMNLVNALYAGKLAKFQDLTPLSITTTSSNLDFGIEYLGQTLDDITITINPISTNIVSIGSIPLQTNWSKLEQRAVQASISLDPAIVPGEEINFQVTLSSGSYILHQADIRKFYQPNVIFQDNPDVDGISNWNQTGGWGTDTDAYSGTTAIADSPSGNYGNNENKTLTLINNFDISSVNTTVVQFYAKWDLERNFDYVQLQASSDGGTVWTALSGKYTKPGATLETTPYNSANSSNTGTGKSSADRDNQPDGEPIFDGYRQDKWTMEEFVIDPTSNGSFVGASDLRFRFVFDSDNSNRPDGYSTTFDGFTFDDFTVSTYNLSIPCSSTIESISLPYAEGFNADIGDWIQNTGDDGNWTIDNNGTASGGTGPSAPFEGSDYLYIEASDPVQTGDPNAIGFPGQQAVLDSPCFDLTNFSNSEINFRYHMFSTDADPAMGTIDLEISIDEGRTWTNIFTQSGDQGDMWNLATVNLDTYTGNIVRFRITGTTGTTFRSDIGLDDINLLAGTTDYTYDAGAWSPSDPSGVATCVDNMFVLSGTPTLSGDTDINDITISIGASLDIASTSLNVCGDISNTGSLLAVDGSITMQGATAQTIFGNPIELREFVIDNATTVTLGGPLSIKELLQLEQGNLVSAGNLTLLSNATETAMIDEVTTAAITGDVTVERFIPARRAFRFLSSSVTTTTSINANWQEGVNNTGISFPSDNMNPNPGYGTHITGSTTGANGFDATASGNPSLFIANNTTQSFSAVNNTDTRTLTAGFPYLLLVRGDRSTDITTNGATPSDTRLRATGSLFTGGLTITGANLNHNAGEFNFIGNPYQASVDMNAVVAGSNNINTNQYYVWDPTLGARGAYVTVLLTGTGSSNGAGSAANHYIQPGQAAFVTTATTVGDNSTAVSFIESDKEVGQNTSVFFDGQSSDDNDPIVNNAHIIGQLFRTEALNNGEKLQDNFVVIFSPDYSNAITLQDADKWFNQDENIGITAGESTLSVERRFMPSEDEEIQLYSGSYKTEDYTMRILQEGLTDVTAYFVDRYAESSIPLENGENFVSFAVDSTNEESMASDRFSIKFSENSLSTNRLDSFAFAMYPNPLHDDLLTITSDILSGQDVSIKLHNVLGQVVLDKLQTFSQNTTITGMSKLNAGIYFISLTASEGTVTKRLIIQ